jgi:hypothetical protein
MMVTSNDVTKAAIEWRAEICDYRSVVMWPMVKSGSECVYPLLRLTLHSLHGHGSAALQVALGAPSNQLESMFCALPVSAAS